MFAEILFALWFFAPAGLANAAPVFAARFNVLKPFDKPLDAGASFRDRRIFGDHKTWRGLLAGAFVGLLAGFLQFLLVNFAWEPGFLNYLVDYQNGLTTILLGGMLGVGALLGDAIKSFFKRQVNITSGKSWFPFDQLDYIVGALALSLPFVQLRATDYAYIFLLWFGLHVVIVYIGWRLKWRKNPI